MNITLSLTPEEALLIKSLLQNAFREETPAQEQAREALWEKLPRLQWLESFKHTGASFPPMDAYEPGYQARTESFACESFEWRSTRNTQKQIAQPV